MSRCGYEDRLTYIDPPSAFVTHGCRINRSANRSVNQSRDNICQPIKMDAQALGEVANERRNSNVFVPQLCVQSFGAYLRDILERERPRVRRRSVASVPGRPADGRGDRRGHAPHRRAPHGWRLRALIVVLWRGGLRIHEALALTEHDLDPRRGSLLVRNGKGGKRRRELGMDEWGWEQLRPWLARAPSCRRAAVLHHRRPHPRAALGERRGPPRAAPARHPSRRPAPVRAAPAAPRARARARPRRRPAQHHPAPARPHQPRHHLAGSGRGAVPALPPVRFPAPPSEPDVHVPAHPALHRTRDGRSCRRVRQRRFPVEWWLVLFRWPPTARGCGGPDSDIGSPEPRRARRASCLRGWSSGAPSTVA